MKRDLLSEGGAFPTPFKSVFKELFGIQNVGGLITGVLQNVMPEGLFSTHNFAALTICTPDVLQKTPE